jgi:hypothetical protein
MRVRKVEFPEVRRSQHARGDLGALAATSQTNSPACCIDFSVNLDEKPEIPSTIVHSLFVAGLREEYSSQRLSNISRPPETFLLARRRNRRG